MTQPIRQIENKSDRTFPHRTVSDVIAAQAIAKRIFSKFYITVNKAYDELSTSYARGGNDAPCEATDNNTAGLHRGREEGKAIALREFRDALAHINVDMMSVDELLTLIYGDEN